MYLEEWCNAAQNDQNTLRAGHLYGNYRQSRGDDLITAQGTESFRAALSTIDRATEAANFSRIDPRDRDGGFANFIVEKGKQKFYRPPSPTAPAIRSDFRLDAKPISPDDKAVFLTLARDQIVPRSGATRSSTTGPARRSPSPSDILWLTRPDDVVASLREAAIGRRGTLNERRFFAVLTALLGLRPGRSRQTRYRIDLYYMKRADVLFRPHGLSTGYPDRFCGKSNFREYGATVDNRDGTTGLPEAICLASNAEQILMIDKIYGRLKRRLNRFAPWIDPTSTVPIEAVLDTTDVHSDDLDYLDLQPLILKRLKERPESCRGSASLTCYCRPSGIIGTTR